MTNIEDERRWFRGRLADNQALHGVEMGDGGGGTWTAKKKNGRQTGWKIGGLWALG